VVDLNHKQAQTMVSLAQGQTVHKLEAEGWAVVESSRKQAQGGPVMMMRQVNSDVAYILVMPNGERSAQPPTPEQIRDW
jgi:hypothetical protein